jgi:predicted phage terminase large subunit-like protein
VFEEWGLGIDGKLYLIDMIRGKWEAPELQKRAVAFWAKCKMRDVSEFGQLRKIAIEDKVSGTGLLQTIRFPPYNIPVEPIEQQKDKLTRCMDALPYIECGQVAIPEAASFTNDFIQEMESFTADDSHDHDDQCDCLFFAVQDMLQSGNIIRQWQELGKNERPRQDTKKQTPQIRR